MRILQLCHKIPFPPIDGGCIAINNITEALINSGHQVKILAIATPKNHISLSALPQDYRNNTKIETVFIDTEVKPIPALLSLLKGSSYNIDRFYSKSFEQRLIQILKETSFDIIDIESLFVTPYITAIRNNSNAKILFRSHNIEHKIWEHLATTETNILKKFYLKILSTQLKRYEGAIDCDGIAPITTEDGEYYKKVNFKGPIKTISFGLDVSKYSLSKTNNTGISFFHIGSMDWMPNIEGINWFIKNVWHKISSTHAQAKLFLAGKKMPNSIQALASDNLIVEGYIENAIKYMQNKSVMIVPLFSGSGMRIKIIEGMALGKTIISTSLGAEGIPYLNNKNILIANTENEFIEVITNIVNGKINIEEVGKNARKLVEEKFDVKKTEAELNLLFDQMIKSK